MVREDLGIETAGVAVLYKDRSVATFHGIKTESI